MSDLPIALFLSLHCLATVMMTGLIWFVQITHYPLMTQVGPDVFLAYEKEHKKRTTWIVGPLMVVELATAFGLLLVPVATVSTWLALLGLFLILVIWASTFFVQVPLHTRLSRQFCVSDVEKLVTTNWIRTTAWSGRSLLALLILVQY